MLDTHLDWMLAVRQLLDKAGLAGSDLVGSSVGGSFAAEMAAVFPGTVQRLVLIAPFGLFDEGRRRPIHGHSAATPSRAWCAPTARNGKP